MKIVDFSNDHIEDAIKLQKLNYVEERKEVSFLPEMNAFPSLMGFADNGFGCAAYEDNRMLGFLCCYTPWERAFTTTAKGTFSPIHAHGAVLENREKIYKYLYQGMAEKLVKAGVTSHSIGLYAHDKAAIQAFFTYGFGLRCVDAIRDMTEIPTKTINDYDFFELEKTHHHHITPLRLKLSEHLSKTPCFMKNSKETDEAWIKRALERDSRVFVAKKDHSYVAFMEVMDDGENFATNVNAMKNICGAYCLQEHRGTGVYQNLLNYVIKTLKKENFTLLGVDFESFNPTASGFWLKYFTAYTNGVVRRIDENAIYV